MEGNSIKPRGMIASVQGCDLPVSSVSLSWRRLNSLGTKGFWWSLSLIFLVIEERKERGPTKLGGPVAGLQVLLSPLCFQWQRDTQVSFPEVVNTLELVPSSGDLLIRAWTPRAQQWSWWRGEETAGGIVLKHSQRLLSELFLIIARLMQPLSQIEC